MCPQEYGDIEYCVILKNKTTGESKGLGYVRYYKPSQAALAIENCDKSKDGPSGFRCVFVWKFSFATLKYWCLQPTEQSWLSLVTKLQHLKITLEGHPGMITWLVLSRWTSMHSLCVRQKKNPSWVCLIMCSWNVSVLVVTVVSSSLSSWPRQLPVHGLPLWRHHTLPDGVDSSWAHPGTDFCFVWPHSWHGVLWTSARWVWNEQGWVNPHGIQLINIKPMWWRKVKKCLFVPS